MERADQVALVDNGAGEPGIESALSSEAFEVHTVPDIESLEALLEARTVDCVVSTYQVPRRDGLEYLGGLHALETVATLQPDAPRILYTDIVNQDIAREAVALGLFDYIPTNTDESLDRLVTRVVDATEKRRAQRRVAELSRVNEVIREVLTVLVRAESHERVYEEVTTTLVATEAYDGALFGRRTETGVERLATAGTVTASAVERSLEDGEGVTAVEGDRRSVAVPVTDDGLVLVLFSDRPEAFGATERDVLTQLGGAVRYSLDAITDAETLERREAALAEKTERLSTFASVVGHDLRNPLSVASGNLELAMAGETERLDAVESALTRMSEMIDDVLALARDGERSITLEPVDLAATVEAAWGTVDTGDATLDGPETAVLTADVGQLQRLLENLFRNSIEHGGPDVSVTVERTETGFAVRDDGPGFSQSDPASVFELGVTGSASGTGLGLAIVESIAEAHGWSVSAGESERGGARFELSGVDFAG
ncbi:response regulator [Halomicroarcula sp. F28]|uniref:ATP-binding response regulator n=1 Tax=Haloarcula salinisoli TaxID=2487746 RepID=UPI001C72B353|nr:hybrid sensor histidine kinase/response regulator [Halomicroarcula salinisoli]MBX0286326.1 response regulator [Halomicroarcula salinisoli]